jgi:hypothetical protein
MNPNPHEGQFSDTNESNSCDFHPARRFLAWSHHRRTYAALALWWDFCLSHSNQEVSQVRRILGLRGVPLAEFTATWSRTKDLRMALHLVWRTPPTHKLDRSADSEE